MHGHQWKTFHRQYSHNRSVNDLYQGHWHGHIQWQFLAFWLPNNSVLKPVSHLTLFSLAQPSISAFLLSFNSALGQQLLISSSWDPVFYTSFVFVFHNGILCLSALIYSWLIILYTVEWEMCKYLANVLHVVSMTVMLLCGLYRSLPMPLMIFFFTLTEWGWRSFLPLTFLMCFVCF